jgi:Fur family transcriptional regulator, ferric uptake regulator
MNENTQLIEKLKTTIKQKGLKYTKQREIIFETLLNTDKHLTAEELYTKVMADYPEENIGIATVYRALAFLEESNLISSISLNKDGKKFESNTKEHHDHLICTKCDKIIEFVDEDIEKKQETIAKKYNFTLTDHTMYLYGICKECKENK